MQFAWKEITGNDDELKTNPWFVRPTNLAGFFRYIQKKKNKIQMSENMSWEQPSLF